MVTIHGRVRATVRLRDGQLGVSAGGAGIGEPCVLATSWASDRAFPRTVGVGVPFEIETAAGEVFRVDPSEALVALPVRRRERDGGISREYGWLAPADEITVDGELDPEDPASPPPALHAKRIALPAPATGPADVHRVPPRALRSGEADAVRGEASTPISVESNGAVVVHAQRKRKGRRHPETLVPDPLPAPPGEGKKEEE
jgi:hypothetical protein